MGSPRLRDAGGGDGGGRDTGAGEEHGVRNMERR